MAKNTQKKPLLASFFTWFEEKHFLAQTEYVCVLYLFWEIVHFSSTEILTLICL